MEESRCCANPACGTTLVAGESKKGWALKSGGFAELCKSCGTAYEKLFFCELFHPKESGWRECSSCGKRLHCGCIVSKSFVELLEYGGVQCKSCMANLELHNESASCSPRREKTNELGTEIENVSPLLITVTDDCIGDGTIAEYNNANTENVVKAKSCTEGFMEHVKNELVATTVGGSEATTWGPEGLSCDDNERSVSGKLMHTFSQSCLDISLGTSDPHNRAHSSFSSETTQTAAAALSVVNEGYEKDKTISTYQQLQRARHILPKPSRINTSSVPEPSKDIQAQIRVVRPPAEGRGRNQLLPRYWPRISDQELQQMTGDSNSTIVPLFEKVLSASDAGRIGRLVLPKACAEAYFPPISQPEGLPLKIQDAKGKDWIFQFRFWPNNNSRMYVLEGVTPCIQSMQLQAGDTVTFSRIEPEGKLLMGFRKATNSMQLEDSQIFAISGGSLGNENFPCGFIDSLPMVRGYPGPLQTLKRSADPQFGAFAEEGNMSWLQMDKLAGKSIEGLHKKSRNIGVKSKRLHIDNEDAIELKLTWEEAQDLLRPPVCVKPSVVMVDDYEFEEYEEPPVFGKRTIFTAHISGVHDQWAQCDHCFKWRRLPVSAILSSKWTCADNIWDSNRSSCSAPDELNQREMQNLLQLNAEFRKQKISATQELAPLDHDVSGVEAMETAAVTGYNASTCTPLVATTTRHPRHRPGCTCIVCIQPPSGKGPKHKPTCTCNVCMTVKRRFTTLMMRKKKRQCEIEDAELSKKTSWSNKDDTEADGSPSSMLSAGPHSDPQSGNDRYPDEKLEKGIDHIDLNYNPSRKGQQPAGLAHMSMMSLLHVANLPLENYLKQTGLTSLAVEQVSSSSCGTSRAPGENEGMAPNQSYLLKQQEQGVCADDQCAKSASPE